jgi:DNA-binding NarL/FixJ family response regulator
VIRVLIADDDHLLRAGLAIILDTAPDIEVVAESSDGVDALAAVRRTSPDLALLDIRMPRIDGLSAARSILAAPNPPKVIMLTTFDLDEYVYAALTAGASGFLLKDTPPERLVSAVRHVLTGDVLLAPAITTRLVARHTAPAWEAARRLGELTDRERHVLGAVAEGLSNADIGRRLFIGEATVKTHVSRILAKLGLRDRTQAVIYAYESGLVRPRGS